MNTELKSLDHTSVKKTIKDTDKNILVIYSTSRCPDCKTLKKTVELMLEKGDITNEDIYYFSLEGKENQTYGLDLGIRTIPTMIKYNQGGELTRVIGSKTPNDIKKLLHND